MNPEGVESFRRERERLNDLVLKHADLNVKRFYNLDAAVYRTGALPAKTKELLGLAASLVLRCDDCVLYHLIRCREEQVTDAELGETVAVALVAGGSITIPHIRRLWDAWETLVSTAPEPEIRPDAGP
jgi:AhpD family alkylhydroperoxidase